MTRPLPRPVTMPWGKGHVVDEVSVEDEYKEAVIQLIEWDGGGQTLRFCQYWPDGRFQRQPMMLNVGDLPAMREALKKNERLYGILRALVED